MIHVDGASGGFVAPFIVSTPTKPVGTAPGMLSSGCWEQG